ncbi:ATP-binding cassette sub-family C member 10 isoform X2 [Aphidius gifuensis]|uniref:ATP-binding cassette sub-family C member 10 isoform X2 n=1 Tax=Aphidius gifuensis TaxID=684658 RepID=UPI001CDD611D|nr:ATP-binding cassette sub-family C member 10 isoform X2 [Aphidius gifuensis]
MQMMPTLALLAITSAYYCGKKLSSSHHQERYTHWAITSRLIITICLIILPIIRAYIILVNTTLVPDSKKNISSILKYSRSQYNILLKNNCTEYFSINDDNYHYDNQATSANPIDYMIAATEGLAWAVHFCFILSLQRGSRLSLRGPVIIRAIIFMLIGTSILILRTHIKHPSTNDVIPNLSLIFSIAVVTFMILYFLTLLPSADDRNRQSRNSRYTEINENTSLLNSPVTSYVHFMEEHDPNYLGTAMEDSTFLSNLLFHWVTPLMEKGVRSTLKNPDDLYDLPEHITTGYISYEIDKFIKKTTRRQINLYVNNDNNNQSYINNINNNKISLLKLLHNCFGWQFYAVGLLKFIADCCGFVGPILLNKLVSFIEDKDKPISYGYLYAFLMFLSTLIGSFAITHFNFWMNIVGLKIRSTVITLVYRKTLNSSNNKLNIEFTFGEIVNFMSTDCDRIVNSCPSFHTFWSIPFQLIVTLYLLYKQIGMSFIAGILFTIILIPINKYIANKIGQLSTKMMNFKDQRVRLIGEVLRGLTTIKLNVWEEHFLDKIIKLRNGEIKYLQGRKYLDALCVYFWATTPVLISILTFTTYVLFGNQLDAQTVFTSMALMNMLIGPLNALPWVLNGLTEAWVSIKRIQRLLNLDDLDTSTFYTDPPDGIDVMLKNAAFTVNDNADNLDNLEVSPDSIISAPSTSVTAAAATTTKKNVSFESDKTFLLKELNLNIKKGQLVGIMGKIGSGKSLLLDGLLAEITKLTGDVGISDLENGFGYVKQIPWLQRGTIRDNILFGKTYEYNKYKNVIKCCALTDDLLSLPKRDLTGIGDAGNTLSGGQKTRISLARAVYADKKIYLLDDIFATLDANVAKYIFQNVILGLLKNKTRIICTHQTKYLIHADLIVEMSNGKIIKQGNPTDILPDLDDYLLSSISIETNMNLLSNNQTLNNDKFEDNDNNDNDTMLDDEYIEKGTVKFGVYGTYFNAVGRSLVVSIILSMILMQSSKNMTDLWLSIWVTHVNTTFNSSSISKEEYLDIDKNTNNYYLTIYAILALLNTIFTLIRAFLFAYGGINSAKTMHKNLLKTIINAKLNFFDSQSLGRILNRFSSDTYTVDDSLPFISNILLSQLFALIGTLIITSYGLPWIFLIFAPLVPIYHWIQHHYRLTSRELKRISSTSLSPLYTHFNETLQGLSCIRAFRSVPRFKHDNEIYLELNQKTIFSSFAAGQWLALRLQFIGIALLAGVCLMAVLQHQFDVADPGLIGLSITYALSVTTLLSGVVNTFTETEREMISVERIKQYLENVPVENNTGDNPPYAWPGQGVIEFNNVVLRYREHYLPSLNFVTFKTRPAEKIGIVGRTGAGKSSLFNTLFRLVEIDNGSILIDNVNIKSLKLNSLRSRLCIIPQNPFLFSGSIRNNIDPLDEYPDYQINKTIEKCKLTELVNRLGGLDGIIDENGSNLSAGQKQLFCLVRAILHNARILCIDEATANIDYETDRAIQNTIKSAFRCSTVITIAHRIRTIMHCDRVLVMGDGEVLEFDEPNNLLENSDSHFYNLSSQEFSDRE